MANDKRIMLNEQETEKVSGGYVKYTNNPTDGRTCWGERTPDVKYGFYDKEQFLAFLDENYDYYGEKGIFDAMLEAGIIYNLPAAQ